MFTTIDKALTAILMGILSLLNIYGVVPVPETWIANVNMIIAAVTPFLVWLIPNKGAAT